MFEREIKFIYDFNLNKVNKLGPYFTFEQLQNVDLHPAILNYISAEIDYLIFEDRQKLLKNSVFDYSGEKIAFHFGEITEEVKKIKRFSLEYIAKLILHAASFTVNYLVRPKWTLTRFLFDEAKHKSANEIKQILNYIYYYKFVKKIIVSYINTKKILSMNAEEFEELLLRTDKLGMESNLKGIMSSSLISMAEFFNIGQMQKTRIPLTAVELFLEEKDLPQHLKKITETLGTDENAHFHIGDYMKVITSVMSVTKEDEPNQKETLFFEEQPELPITEDYSLEEKYFVNPDNNENQTDEAEEIIESSDDEVTITPNTKIRIKVNEGIKIESVEEDLNKTNPVAQDDVPSFEIKPLPQTDDEFDSYSSIIKNTENNDESETEEFTLEDKREIEEEKDTFLDKYFISEETESEENEKQELIFGHNEILHKNESDVHDINEIQEPDHAYEEALYEEDEAIQQKFEEQTKLELSEILEHKNITKIIETIFDYDIEDFANMLDEISESKNVDDAHFIINETLAARRINRNSKEAETLRDIISEYFDKKR